MVQGVVFSPAARSAVKILTALYPLKYRAAHIGTALAAGGAGEPGFDVGQPHIIGPLIGVEYHGMVALVVAAEDDHVTDAHLAQLAEGDLLRTGGHGGDRSRALPQSVPARVKRICYFTRTWQTTSNLA